MIAITVSTNYDDIYDIIINSERAVFCERSQGPTVKLIKNCFCYGIII